MTRVAFLLDAIPVSGGAERLVFQTLLAIDRARVECTLIITRWDQEVAASGPGAHILQELETAGVRVIGIRRTSRLSPRTWWAIVRTLRTHRIEVIHSHMFGSNLHAVVTGRIAGVPVIAHEHGLRSSLSVKRRLVDRHLIGRLERWSCASLRPIATDSSGQRACRKGRCGSSRWASRLRGCLRLRRRTPVGSSAWMPPASSSWPPRCCGPRSGSIFSSRLLRALGLQPRMSPS